MVLVVKRNNNGVTTEKLYGCKTIFEQEEYVRKLVNPSGTSVYFMLTKPDDSSNGVLELKMPYRDEQLVKDIMRMLNTYDDIDRIEIECKANNNVDIMLYAGLIPHVDFGYHDQDHRVRHIFQVVGTLEII